MSIGIVIGMYSLASLASSKLSGQKLKSNFSNFSYSYLAAFFIFGLVGSTFGQLLNNGDLYMTTALHHLGINMYIPSDYLALTSLEEYPMKGIIEALIAVLIAAYIAYRIARNMFANNIKKMILASGPHISMIVFLVLIFTTISPRWS